MPSFREPGNPLVTAISAAAVTTSDTQPLAITPCRALYIGVGGALKVTMADGTVCVFAVVLPGLLPISANIIWANGTTCTSIVALY